MGTGTLVGTRTGTGAVFFPLCVPGCNYTMYSASAFCAALNALHLLPVPQSFSRALELDSSRLYSLLQAAALNHQLGSLSQAAELYSKAIQLKPGHPAALLGAAEAKLASAQVREHRT